MADTDQSHSPQPDMREQQRHLDQSRVDTFVIRARRIEAHSLAQDTQRLIKLSGGAMEISIRKGRTFVTFDYPPEEQVESAAARVRPLLLTDVSMMNVFKSIKSLTSASEDRAPIRAWITDGRARWVERTNETPGETGFKAFMSSTTSDESAATDHMQLALAWIYGDVVHHDPKHLERTKRWGVGERFRAAVPLVAYIMIEAINVLMNIREMDKRGALTVSPEAWTVPVVAEENYEREAELYLGQIGTELPGDTTQPLSAEWKRFDQETLAEWTATLPQEPGFG